MSQRATAPRHCPACATELYPIARMRPRPALSLTAKLLMLIGWVASAGILIGGMIWFTARREIWRTSDDPRMMPVPGRLAGVITFIPAIIPGLLLGIIAYRLPKSLKLRCPKCSWRERYKLARDGQVTPAGISPIPQAENPRAAREINRQFEQINAATPLAPAPDESGYDANPEVSAWIYGEIAAGRSPEDVTAQLVEMGWRADVAEHLAEIGRRQTRHLRR